MTLTIERFCRHLIITVKQLKIAPVKLYQSYHKTYLQMSVKQIHRSVGHWYWIYNKC